jgi:hypothetical protein
MAHVRAFLKELSHSVGVEVKNVSMEGTWRKTRPDIAQNQTAKEHLDEVSKLN